MNEAVESAQINIVASRYRPIRVDIVPFKYLTRVVQSMQHGALASAVGAEQKRDRLEFKLQTITNSLEILNGDLRDHSTIPVTFGVCPRATRLANDASRRA